jgi:uncharacterized protein YjbI with pentapeptide repeats
MTLLLIKYKPEQQLVDFCNNHKSDTTLKIRIKQYSSIFRWIKTYIDVICLNKHDLRNIDLSNLCIKVKNKKDIDFSGCNMSGCDMSNSFMYGANFADAIITNANMTNTTISNANLINTNLSNANMTNINMTWVNWSIANLTNANLTNAKTYDRKLFEQHPEVYFTDKWKRMMNRRNYRSEWGEYEDLYDAHS